MAGIATPVTKIASVTTDISFGSVFGSAIPLLIGKCIVNGIPFWTSADTVTKTETTTTVGSDDAPTKTATTSTAVTFAVAFGRPDPAVAHSYISRLWINGVLSYDATGKSPITAAGLTLTLYPGSETQQPDPAMALVVKPCPAFRGIVYAVIAGVDFTNLTGLPSIVAEIDQSNDISFTFFQPAGTPGYDYVMALSDGYYDKLTMIARQGIDIFDLDSETLLQTKPLLAQDGTPIVLESPVAGANFQLLKDGKTYAATVDYKRPAEVGGDVALIDLETNKIVANWHQSYLYSLGAARGCGQWSEYLLAGVFNPGPFLRFGLKGRTITRIADLGPVEMWSKFKRMDVPEGSFAPSLATAHYVNRSKVQTVYADADAVAGVPIIYIERAEIQPITGSAFIVNEAVPTDDPDTADPTSGGYWRWFVAGGQQKVEDATWGKLAEQAKLSDIMPPIDTTQFSVAWAIGGDNRLYRIILCDGKDVPFVQMPSMVPRNRTIVHVNAGIQHRDQGEGTTWYGPVTIDEDNARHYDSSTSLDTKVLGPLRNGTGQPIHGREVYILNEPMIVATTGGDRCDLMHTTAAGDKIVHLHVGPATNPFVAIIINKADGTTVLRRFDTFWSRKADLTVGADWDAHYYYFVEDKPLTYNPNLYGSTYTAELQLVDMSQFTRDYCAAYADVVIPAFPVNGNGLSAVGMDAIKQEPADFLVYGSGGLVVQLDVYAGVYSTKGQDGWKNAAGAVVPSPVLPTATIDYVNGLVYFATSSLNFYLNSGLPLGDMELGSMLKSLCVMSGLDPADIDISGMAATAVQGCVVNQTVSLTDLLNAIQDAFSMDVFDPDGRIHFVRKERGAGLAFDYEFTDDDVATGEGDEDVPFATYERAYSADLPTTQTLEYIDSDNFGTVGTQTAKRTRFPVKTTAAEQVVDTSIPVIMSAAQAIYWANTALFEKWAAGTAITYRLGPEAFKLEPGDYIRRIMADGTPEPTRVKTVTLNADLTVTVTGTNLIQFNDFAGPGDQGSLIKVTDLTKSAPPTGCVFDNVLFSIDDDAPDAMPIRFTADQAIGLYVYRDTAYFIAGSSATPSPVGKVVVPLPAAGATGSHCVFETDSASVLRLTFPDSRTVIAGASDANFRAGKSLCLVGGPGRWELLWFRDAIKNADGTWSLSMFRRGQRGTEAAAAYMAAGDVIVFPVVPTAVFNAKLSDIGKGLALRYRGQGTGAAGLSSQTITPGATKLPWAPVNVRLSRVASASTPGWFDYTFRWNRRTRDEKNVLRDRAASVPNEFGAAAFAGTISTGNAGQAIVVRSFKDIAVEAYVYTAEQQQADGFKSAPASLVLSVAQTTDLGSGPAAVGVFNITHKG